MNEITILGVDLAKNTFQLIGVDKHHKVVKKLRCSRAKFIEFVSQLPRCTILMEACGTSNHWGREFEAMGHEVKLISPQHVTPYVANHKNDYKDTEAIIEAGTRPRTKFVSIKTIEQQDIQSILRFRERLINKRITLSNQIRGLLSEYGIRIPTGFASLKRELAGVLDFANTKLSMDMKEVVGDAYEEFQELSARIAKYDKKVKLINKQNAACKLLQTIPGVGDVSAAALYAAVGNGSQFKNGREMAAHIGLVPRQHSSGDKQKLLGLTKKGNGDLKELLIHGARAVVRNAHKKSDRRSCWINNLMKIKHPNVVAAAVANRTARMVWAILQSSKPYHSDKNGINEEGGVCYPQSANSLHNMGGLRELPNCG